MSGGVVACAADRRGIGFDRETFGAQHIEHLGRFGDDLRTDAVAGKERDLHARRPLPGTDRC
jgi:hypothetical protein